MAKRSPGQQAAKKRQQRAAGHKADSTTNESESFCANWITKKFKGETVLQGAPDFTFIKNKKLSYYEVKPYLWKEKGKTEDWRVADKKRRVLSVAQLKTFKKLITLKQNVYIIYYNREVKSKNADPCYTIHDGGKKMNPRPVDIAMLKNQAASDPHLEYFNGYPGGIEK